MRILLCFSLSRPPLLSTVQGGRFNLSVSPVLREAVKKLLIRDTPSVPVHGIIRYAIIFAFSCFSSPLGPSADHDMIRFNTPLFQFLLSPFLLAYAVFSVNQPCGRFAPFDLFSPPIDLRQALNMNEYPKPVYRRPS